MFRSSPVAFALILFLTACGGGTAGKPTPLGDQERQAIYQAVSLEKSGDMKGAVRLYEEAIRQSRGSIEAYLALSRFYLERGSDSEAKKVLEDARRKQPSDPEVNLRLGKIAVRQGKAEEALRYFDTGLKQVPQNMDLLNGRGVALDVLGRHAEAQRYYEKALSQPGEDTAFVQNNLALSYIMTGSYDQAITLLSAIPGMKDIAVIRQNLALAYGLKGDMVKARQWSRKDLSEAEMQENIAFYKAYKTDWQHRTLLPQPPSGQTILEPVKR